MRVVHHRAFGRRSACISVDIAEPIELIRFRRRYFRVVFS